MSRREATEVPERSTLTTVLISNTSSIRWEMNTTLVPPAVSSRTIVEEPVPGGDVERRGGLVQDEHLRLGHEGPGDAAGLPAGQGQLLDGGVHVHAVAEEPFQHLGGPPAPVGVGAGRAGGIRARRCPGSNRPGTVRTSWKTVESPRARARAGLRRPSAGTPSITREPRSGRCTPERILTRVLLPLPFSPMTVCTSPGRISRFARTRARVAPNDLAMPVATSRGARAASRPVATGHHGGRCHPCWPKNASSCSSVTNVSSGSAALPGLERSQPSW